MKDPREIVKETENELARTSKPSEVRFEITKRQYNQIVKWVYEHDCSITNDTAIGGKISYQFTPNSLGMTVKAICACGEELNVTDYTGW